MSAVVPHTFAMSRIPRLGTVSPIAASLRVAADRQPDPNETTLKLDSRPAVSDGGAFVAA
jgi:hypothetical protein